MSSRPLKNTLNIKLILNYILFYDLIVKHAVTCFSNSFNHGCLHLIIEN